MAARNFRPDASRVHASVFIVHGINDTNVTTTQFAQWWGRLGVPKKIWLSQMSHVDPFDIRRGGATTHSLVMRSRSGTIRGRAVFGNRFKAGSLCRVRARAAGVADRDRREAFRPAL